MKHDAHALAYANAEYADSFFLLFKPKVWFIRAPSIFVSVFSNPLKLTRASSFRIFKNIHQKWVWRKMNLIYRT